MAWYGPAGDCGCQCGPVPPPDCICEDFPLLGESDQFLSVKVEIEFFQDEWEWTSVQKFGTGCAPLDPCRNKQITETIYKKLSNLQSINGTYDIGYYHIVDGEFVPGTIGDTPCGFWFFPNIVFSVEQYATQVTEVEGDCEPGFESISENTSDFIVPLIDCRWLSLFGSLNLNPGVIVTAADPPPAQFRFERTAFAGYDPLGIGDTFVDVEVELDTSGAFGGVLGKTEETVGFNPTLRMPVFPGWGVSMGKIIDGQEIVTIDGVQGYMRPFFKPRCILGAQQVSAELQSYSYSLTNSTSNCEGTPDPPQIESSYDLSFGALKWRVRLILEV